MKQAKVILGHVSVSLEQASALGISWLLFSILDRVGINPLRKVTGFHLSLPFCLFYLTNCLLKQRQGDRHEQRGRSARLSQGGGVRKCKEGKKWICGG